MKRLIITCYLLSVICCLFASEANDLYAAGEYAEAAALYEQLVAEQPSAVAYYNLGNAYFKQGELAQSILAYERSLRLDPTNRDTRYNLRFAESRITDNIADNRAFFLSTVMTDTRNLLRENTWIIISLSTFFLFVVCLLLFLLSGEPVVRKTGFSLAVIMLVMAIFSFCFADSLHRRDTMREEAIITQGVVNAKASPDRSGTELFTIHEGTKVSITETLGEWCNITVGNYQGWIQLQNLERI
ncbi:MAG: tetratricopeptide repeat protein [Paludibacteraceae bacterium]|nr:tetratricopeptide repeat protein [Paludibacteraceae bacterium]